VSGTERTAPPRHALTVLVVVGGACSLGAEMAGARLLAPHFGTSNLVWANVIGMFLLYLSVGYWLGGKLADRHPNHRTLAYVVLGAAVTIAILPFIARPLFSLAMSAFEGVSAGGFIASFFGTMLLFAVPVTALGTISPWAIRLAVTDVNEAGTVAGRLYALSTIGSLVGTFLPVLVLIPWIGTQRTIIAIAAALALATLPLLPRRAIAAPLALAALLVVPPGITKGVPDGRLLYEGESRYQYVQVVERPDGDRVLHLNEGWAIHSVLPARGFLTGGYWDAFLTLPVLTGSPDGRVAILGNAGGTIGNLYEHVWPDAPLDGVEIDPLVSDVGRRFLGMKNPRMRIHTADARVWIQNADDGYDGMVVDAYRQPYIPFQLVSREFFTLVRDRLSPRGVVAINVGTPPDQTEAVDMIAATMRDVFPTVLATRYDEFNSVVFAFRSPTDPASVRALLDDTTGPAGVAGRRIARDLTEVAPGGTVLTDDHAPIEWVTDMALVSYLRQGAPGASNR